MQRVTIAKALSQLNSNSNLLLNFSVCGEITTWQLEEKHSKQFELTDNSGSAVFQIQHSQKNQLKLMYLTTFAQIGVTLEISGLQKPNKTWLKKGINFWITSDLPPEGTDLNFYGSPKFSELYIDKVKDLTIKNHISNKTDFATAADLYAQEISRVNDSQDNSRKITLTNTFAKHNDEISFFADDSSDSVIDYDNNNFNSQKNLEQKYLPWENYDWSISQTGQLLKQKSLENPIFSAPVESNHPRLSLVFQFHPPENGILSIYWLTSEKKWILIIQIKSNKKDDYFLLKKLTSNIVSLEEVYDIFQLDQISRYNILPEE